ncbi:MAG: 6-bladed beta-propeller [Bacteroidales bacterium]|jgi:hypothetical protein|nr:6-bladed beta-propeller [Bacteroidales bacterium]
MKNGSLFLPALLIILCIACNHRDTKPGDPYSSEDGPMTIALDPDMPESPRIREIIDTVIYIPLETTPGATVGEVSKVIFRGKRIYIGDFESTESIYCFTAEGKFLFSIQNKGKGPGEYVSLNDFDVEEKSGRIFVHDSYTKAILIYDSKGQFIRKHVVRHIFTTFNLAGGRNAIAYAEYIPNPTLPGNPASNIFIFNYETGEIIDSFLPFDENLQLHMKIRGQINYTSYTREVSYIHDYFTNSIYSFENNSLSRRWIIDFGGKSIPKDFWKEGSPRTEMEEISDGRFCSGIANYQVAGNHIIGCYSYKNSVYMFIFDSRDQSVISIKNAVIQREQVFPVILAPPFHTDGENIVSVIEPAWFARLFELSTPGIFLPAGFEGLDIYSNPVLQIIKLK